MPADLKWQKLEQTGDCPKARSGHSITQVSGGPQNFCIMYGGIVDAQAGQKIQPTSELYRLSMVRGKAQWTKEALEGETPIARAQHVAINPPKSENIFIYGGHASPTRRLNDCWWIESKGGELKWRRVKDDKDVDQNQESSIGAPPPRANCGYCYANGKIYIYGGHGGLSYQRIAFNDIYSFDLATEIWERHESIAGQTPIPDGRGGNSIFVTDDKLYSFGGWNSETQFFNTIYYDFNTKEWTDPDILIDTARWNHSSLLVEAIPSWKYFVFGGESTNFAEGQTRSFGEVVNTAAVLDLLSFKWEKIKPENSTDLPAPREYSAMFYEKNQLVIFGGWNNGWLNDMYTLNVSKVVGPPYAITEIDPPLGQLSGGDIVTIRGQGFREQNCNVYFTCGNQPISEPTKLSLFKSGQYVNETTMTCETPDFTQFAPRFDCIVQLQFSSEDLTTTWKPYSFFMNTRAAKSLCYGPGVLEEQLINETTSFVIQARNDNAENRKSGRDVFQVTVNYEDDKSEVQAEIVDQNDGSYLVHYKAPREGKVSIKVLFKDDKGKFVEVRGCPYTATFTKDAPANSNALMGNNLQKHITSEIAAIQTFLKETAQGAQIKDKDISDVKVLLSVKDKIEDVKVKNDLITLKLDQLEESLAMLGRGGIAKDKQIKENKKLNDDWVNVKKLAKDMEKEIKSNVTKETENNAKQITTLEDTLKQFTNNLKRRDFYKYDTGREQAMKKLEAVNDEIREFQNKIDDFGFNAKKFNQAQLIEQSQKLVDGIDSECAGMKILWDQISKLQMLFSSWQDNSWALTKPYDMEDEAKRNMKSLKEMKVDKKNNAYIGIQDEIKKWLVFLPMIAELRDDAMRDRHWDAIRKKVGVNFADPNTLVLKDIFNLNLNKYQEDVEEIADQAKQEAKMEKTLKKLSEIWKEVKFQFTPMKDSDVQQLKLGEEDFEMLEENQMQVQSMTASRYLATFEEEVTTWQRQLGEVSNIVVLISEIQRTWSFLESLFMHSDEVKKELPEQSKQFVAIDQKVRDILADGFRIKLALDFCNQDYINKALNDVQKDLTVCEKALQDFMSSKQKAFPRFYFVASADLLDILSNGNNPGKIMKHMPKIFLSIDSLELKESNGKTDALSMISCVGVEQVTFSRPLRLQGKVETYLRDVIKMMNETLKDIGRDSLKRFKTLPKQEWLLQDPAQITMLINILSWVENVELSLAALVQNPKSLDIALDAQIQLLTELIILVRTDLDSSARQKVMCLITMDAHSRDIIMKLRDEGVKQSDEFQWQSQLKTYFNEQKNDFDFKIADAVLAYGYEYLGNGPRLVVTPLTDRIYVTATQALHLKMGCAPAGPAGTGKTETTKDLAGCLAKAIYVTNCSDQMDFQGMGGIFKGLASSGSWGCFDEFNRLLPSVLSVCSVQFKAVTDAIKAYAKTFIVEGDELELDPTCGVFITMNPGYLGRAELPEGLKALFRPITVVVPDLELICENMLMAEGFTEAKLLAKKFTTLYALCRDLLSKAMHYDWGLRAIKSVLVVAGTFKRAEPNLPEQNLLMRALRDFNTPKIVADDLKIFMGLLGDLFPGIDPPRRRDLDFEKVIEAVILENEMHNEPNFILKVVQLKELLAIRHCVFIMGPPGSGKSSTWKILSKAQTKVGNKTTIVDLNPKVVKTDELYGVVHMQTREWIDGLLSFTMRDLGQRPGTDPKYIVLDGDLDANWIESMNSVMDDNKILTLASNERIKLLPHMRLLFEIRNLKFATPATVSRAGILFISDASGYQWKAYIESWVKQMKYTDERKIELRQLFDKYIQKSLDHIKKTFKYLIPTVEVSMIMSLCKLLQAMFAKNDVKSTEMLFVFCCVWCLGAGFGEKDNIQYRKNFSNWWKDTWKIVKFQSSASVFDFYVDFEVGTGALAEWKKLDSGDIVNRIDTSKRISSITVPTADTLAISYLMKQFLSVKHSPMLIGSAGCGKTQIMKGLLDELTTANNSEYLQQIINFNFYTDSALLQNVLESQLEKKAGKAYGPKGKFILIQFIDDLNMPALDKYETQSAISLVRQHKDYEHWYDRAKLSLKEIKNTMYVAAMNPTAGSFVIDDRLQRHFWQACISFPENNSLITIFNAFMSKHFQKFKGSVFELVPTMIKTTIAAHEQVTMMFRKTAINFHYEFNVRHLTNVFQGILQAKSEAIKEYDNMVKLWVHEMERIYGDRLVDAKHLQMYRDMILEQSKRNFGKANLTKFFQKENPEPLVFASFVAGLDDKLYDQFPNTETLSQRMKEALNEYNEINAVMDLVLFDDAMKHICKISRIVQADTGHALLVGVGGSGKQSLSRLSSFVCQYTTMSIMISSSYGIGDLKVDLQNYYNRAGLKDEGILFLFTEGQITNEKFLVYINDLLSSGEIADLFDTEMTDSIVNNITPAVKSEGLVPSKEVNWKFFLDRVRRNLHMSLCFSPVGDQFRNRARKFPALVNCTVIDWFHPWPYEALYSVADRFLAEIEMTDEIRLAVIKFLPFSFTCVQEQSLDVLVKERRYIYTTPKSFLELIKLFKGMLGQKQGALERQLEKYENGVVKLNDTTAIVTELEETIKVTAIEVEAAKAEAQEQAIIVGGEKEKVDAQNAIAEEKSAEANKIATEVTAKKTKVQADLDSALPLVEKAMAALACLNEKDFGILKTMPTPPPLVATTFTAVLHLYCGQDPLIPTDKKGRLKDEKPWNTAQKMMSNPKALLAQLNGYKELVDTDKIPAQNFDAIRETLANPDFTPEVLANKSSAAKAVCDWIINITAYYDVVVSVEPKKKAVREAEEQLATAMATKNHYEGLVAELQAKLKILVDTYDAAMAKKENAEATAARCTKRLGLASRLVSALGAEGERWAQSIILVGQQLQVVLGDVLMASSFVSYIGPFNKKYRDFIMVQKFGKFFKENKIPLSENSNPLNILTTEAEMAQWQNEKLPSDIVSQQNGAIMTNSDRYSLIIDPQLQGITWLKCRYGDKNLQVTRLSNKKMISTLEQSIESGKPVLIENLENSIDAVIQPVYARAIIKKGKSSYIKMGDKELNLDPNFKLFLHTKLSNPHYPPEIQAECTLINFTVTEKGLEDQLLSLIVKKERPDLAAEKERLIQQQNSFKITLRDLEADLLQRLADQKGDILDDIELIENLERSKALSTDIKEKVEIAKVTAIQIDEASEQYRPASERGALVYFMMIELTKIHSFYKFSLDSFIIVINRAIDIVAARMNPKKEKAEPVEGEEAAPVEEEPEEDKEMTPRTLKLRIGNLIEQITFEAFDYVRRGTFEKHKLIISTMLTLRINLRKKLINEDEVSALIKKEVALEPDAQPNSLMFMAETVWACVQGLKKVSIFKDLPHNMEQEALQWKKWYGEEKAESADLPKSQKDCSSFHKLLLLRALRPDRLQRSLEEYVKESLGEPYIEQAAFDMQKVYSNMLIQIPVFFVLFPGVDPTPYVEEVGKTKGKFISDGTFFNISMGQGQEIRAVEALKKAGKLGNWIMVQNVHLMTDWMKIFERELEIVVNTDCHPDFRCFISSEPPGLPDMEIIPESILQNSIKISNEAPQDLKANLRRAISKFPQAYYDKAKSHKEPEFKALIFGLCMYHSLILGRRKFGAIGWSKIYNFNDGDLTICGDVLHNYLSKYEKVPYQDLCYIYGDIMYGGHITDDLDRRTNSTYLQVLIKPAIMEGMQLTLSVGFKSPNPHKFERDKYVQFIEEQLPAETPNMFGLHPNAEIGYQTSAGELLFEQILQLQGGGKSGSGSGVDSLIKSFLEKLETTPEFNMYELKDKIKIEEGELPDPFWIVCLQECERMNILISTIKTSLIELDMGLKGQLNITDAMDELSRSLQMGFVPPGWTVVAYFSLKGLLNWFTDMMRRWTQLKDWTDMAQTPPCLWISGLFNPMSFLTAIMQKTARVNTLPLDFIILKTDVLNIMEPNEVKNFAETGAYIYGFFLEGANWEKGRGGEQGYLTDQTLKDLNPVLPVMHVIAVTRDQKPTLGYYECPVYVTKQRGPTFVFKADIKMESEEVPVSKWILSGVALVMAPE